MLCFIALIVFSFLGIFSASHRNLAARAFDCVFRRATLRPCNTGFKEEIRGRLLGWMLRKTPSIAKTAHNHFELLSWLFVIISLASTISVGRGIYNYYYYGSCNGLNQSGFCAFDPAGDNNKISATESGQCAVQKHNQSQLSLNNFSFNDYPQINSNAVKQIVFLGCFSCDYTRQVYSVVKRLATDKQANFIFADYPIHNNARWLSDASYCAYQQDKNKYWQLVDLLFSLSKSDLEDKEKVNNGIFKLGFEKQEYLNCLSATSTARAVNEQIKNIETTGLYGTPTVFVNGKAIVGPKPARVYRLMLK